MTLEAYITKLTHLGLSAEEIFEHIISAITTTKDVMIDSINKGEVDMLNAVINGFEISFSNILENNEEQED